MKRQMELNYNGFIEHIADVLAAEDIETVQNEAWSIEVGIKLLNSYMDQIAKRAIETQDDFLAEWCKHLCIIVAEIMHLQKYRFSELDKEIFV